MPRACYFFPAHTRVNFFPAAGQKSSSLPTCAVSEICGVARQFKVHNQFPLTNVPTQAISLP
jgi:hypothetical protein